MGVVSTTSNRRAVVAVVGLVSMTMAMLVAVTTNSVAAAAAAPGASWNVTGSMITPRANATATLLPNGKVLLAGGASDSSAELYDPATGTWRATGSMTAKRSGHTATLLNNGKVLVATGSGDTSAELYDPGTGAWATTGSLHVVRMGAVAARLSDGKVLVAGGDSTGTGLATAEVYDPATGAWTSTGAMAYPHVGATATALPDGSVLVAGGSIGPFNGTPSAETYNPATRQWQVAASIPVPSRYGTAALLANGKVLVVGGFGVGDTPTGPWRAQPNASIYDPASRTWTAAAGMRYGRAYAAGVVLADGSVLQSGGSDGFSTAYQSTSETFDPATNTWTVGPAMNLGRANQTATALPNGTILVAGGFSNTGAGSGPVASAEIYTPSSLLAGSSLSFSVASLDFGNQPVGMASPSKSVTVTNTGSAPLVLGAPATTSADFSTTTPACGSLAPGTSCALQVTFTPHSPGLIQASLLVPDGTASSPRMVALSGIGGGVPVVTAVSPREVGGQGQPIPLTITGFNLAGGAVAVGGVAATEVACSATTCAASSPAFKFGTFDVTVTTPAGTSAPSPATGFTYTYMAGPQPPSPPPSVPAVTGISPATGPAGGGTLVTVTGLNLTAGTVAFSGTVATAVTCTATSCTATSPAGTGTVHVTVTTSAGASTTSTADQFAYQANPAPANLVPNPGFESAGTPADYWGGGLTRSAGVVHSGSFSLAQTATGTSGGWDLDANPSWYAPVTSSKTYTASVWVRSTAPAAVNLNIDLLSVKGAQIGGINGPKVTLAAGTWVKLTISGIKVTSAATNAGFEPNFAKAAKGTVMYWDDLTLSTG